MPTFTVETKLAKEDECYFLLWGAICKGIVKQINIYIAGEPSYNPEEEGLVDITPLSEDLDPSKPFIEYFVQVDHPILNNKPFQQQRFSQGRVFRNPQALLAAIQSRFNKTYERSI
jgi:hypothetical protein